MAFSYVNSSSGIELSYAQYKESEETLKENFSFVAKTLSDQDILLLYLAFKKQKYDAEVTKNQLGFYSHLEDLFQDEFKKRNLETVCCDGNSKSDGRSEVEKRLIKRFKIIRGLDDFKLIERYIILMNRKIESFHESYCSLDSTLKAMPQRNYFELQMEEQFILKEFEIRGLEVPEMTLDHAATFVGIGGGGGV